MSRPSGSVGVAVGEIGCIACVSAVCAHAGRLMAMSKTNEKIALRKGNMAWPRMRAHSVIVRVAVTYCIEVKRRTRTGGEFKRWLSLNSQALSKGVIPKPRVFTSGSRDLSPNSVQGRTLATPEKGQRSGRWPQPEEFRLSQYVSSSPLRPVDMRAGSVEDFRRLHHGFRKRRMRMNS